jgi:hypothetical protein
VTAVCLQIQQLKASGIMTYSSLSLKKFMTQYRFSPIKTKDELLQAVRYVAEQTSELSKKIIGCSFSIKSLTIFSHFEDEFINLKKILFELGDLYNENNGPRIKLHQPIKIGDNQIEYLRIRQPDSERPQVGCCDFEVEDYFAFKNQYLESHKDNLRLIIRTEYEMIEFFHPGFYVLAYVVSENFSQIK